MSAKSTAQLVVTAAVLEGRNNHGRALARIAWLLRAIFSKRDVATLGHRAAHLKLGRPWCRSKRSSMR
jgi:hypothetical protein